MSELHGLPVSETARERARRWPLRYGNHSISEVASLIAEGRSFEDIARLWELRPRAGADDLRWETTKYWINLGCPGGMAKPDGHSEEYREAWAAWRAQRDSSLIRWLISVHEGAPLNVGVHCKTCHCYEAARQQQAEATEGE